MGAKVSLAYVGFGVTLAAAIETTILANQHAVRLFQED